jgi:hypothetical protein
MKMSSDINKALEIALSCRRCGSPTDFEFNSKTSTWTTYCDCGKTDKHLREDVDKETEELVKTLPKSE